MNGGLQAALAAQASLAVGLVVATVRSRRPATASPPDAAGYFRLWQVQHHAPDVDPADNLFLRNYLRLTRWLAVVPARLGVAPTALSLWSVWLAGWVPVLAAVARSSGRAAAAGAALVVLVSALTDGVDGAVAALTDRSTALGFVVDSVADRLSDGAFIAALVIAGWPVGRAAGMPAVLGVAIGAAVAVLLLEYTRARAGNAGMGEIGVVTMGERPTRVVAAIVGLAGTAVDPGSARGMVLGALLVMTGATLGGLLQLWVHLVRHLR